MKNIQYNLFYNKLFLIIFYKLNKFNCFKLIRKIIIYIFYHGDWGLGIGDWGLGIGDWGLGPIPNPQSPIPNPQSPLI